MMNKHRYGWLTLMIAAIFALASACAPAAAKKEAAAPAALAPADMTIEDGVITRTSVPAFTLDIPKGMNTMDLGPNEIYNGNREAIPYSLIVSVVDLPEGGLEQAAKDSAAGWQEYIKSTGSRKNELTSIEAIDLYDEFPAYQVNLEYLWTDGAYELSIVVHVIEKEGKAIILASVFNGDPDAATAMFESVDLDP